MNATSEQALLCALSADLWGLYTAGRFHTPAHAEKARAWITRFCETAGNLLQASLVVAVAQDASDADDVMARALSYRHRLRRIVRTKTVASLDQITLDCARTLWTRTGTPEPPPSIAGDSPEQRVGRVLYVAMRYCDGLADASRTAGFSDAYISGLVSRAQNPSDDFLIRLAHAAGVGTEWMLNGTDAVDRVGI